MSQLQQNASGTSSPVITGRRVLLVLVGAGVLVAGFAAIAKLVSPREGVLETTVMFMNGKALRVGAPVRVSGIDVGTVREIRIRSESPDHPVAVQMEMRTPYELRIPRGAAIGLATSGLFGETFVDFNIRGATGPPIKNGDVLVSDFDPSEQEKQQERAFQELLNRMKPIQESLQKAADCPCPLKAAKPATTSKDK